MTAPGSHAVDIKHIVALLLLSFILFFNGLGTYSLKEPDEGRYAEIPREMVELHDYVVPHLDYVRYFEKPPLFYWAVALSYKVFGVHEWSFRFPNAFSAFLCVLALYFGARRWLGRDVAFLSSVILMSCLGFLTMARIVTLDMFFTFWLFLSLVLFYGYYREGKPLFLYLFYGTMGLATLTKGPVSVILTGATILIFLASERNLSFLKELKWVKGIVIYLAVTVPWVAAISLREKEFLYFFIIDQNFLRFLTTKHKRTGSLLYFFPVLFGGMLPWSFFIPRAFALLWGKKELRLFFIWTLVVFVFFSISKSKLPPYILPVFPSLSLILGTLFHERWRDKSWGPETVAYVVLFAVFASAILLYGSAVFASYMDNVSDEAREVMKDLKGFSAGLSSVSTVLVAFLLMRRFNRFSLLLPFFTLFSCFIALMLMLNAGVIDKLNTTKSVAEAMNNRTPAPRYIVDYCGFEETLPFYTKRRIVVAAYKGELEMGAAYEDAKDSFITEEDFLKLLSSDAPTVGVLREKRLERLKGLSGSSLKRIDCQGELCMVANY